MKHCKNSSQKLLLSFTALAALFLSSCSTLPKGAELSERSRSLNSAGFTAHNIKKNRYDQRYACVCKMNGKKAKLLIDSGSNTTTIHSHKAKSLQVSEIQDVKIKTQGALGRDITSKLGAVNFHLGSQSISPLYVVINSPELGKKSSIGEHDGVIGLDALSLAGAIIDVSNERLWLPNQDIKRSSNTHKLNYRPGLGKETLPLISLSKYSHLVLKGRLNQKTTYWIVDTGAEMSFIDTESAKHLGLKVLQTDTKMIDFAGDTSKIGLTLADSLQFGNTRLNKMLLAVSNLTSVKNSYKLTGGASVSGILGMDFLKATKALIDSRSKLIHLGEPESQPISSLPHLVQSH